MSTKKKAWKLHDFGAHSADVRCLGLGHKSGRVMVTGGDDHKVNLWSVGKPHCIMSLTGHSSSVESVRFGPDEEMVAAGSLTGALKVWDLEKAKIVRTLAGHKARIKSLDFHPYGNYVATGSDDCSVKLWDIRRKGCIYTYKGHTMCVTSLRFTPDGQWVASASDDTTVKLWDLTAGKLLTELKSHTGPVNSIEFHPSDLLLASGSSDRTVKFWDLESFQCISSSDGDKQLVRSICFHPEGFCLYSACADTMKVYGWEPFICHDIVSIRWSEVADLAITNSQLIAASFNGTTVSTFVVDLTKVAPTGVTSKSEIVREALQSTRSRRSFVLNQSPTSSTHASEPKCSDNAPDKNDSNDDENSVPQADIYDRDDYLKFFKDDANKPGMDKEEPFQAPPEDESPETVKVPAALETVKVEYVQPAVMKEEVSPSSKPMGNKQVKGPVEAEDLLPKSSQEMTEKDLSETLMTGHTAMITVLQQRARNLQVVTDMWKLGNTKTAFETALSLKDNAALVDLLNILNTKSSVWSLDLCTLLLPQLKELMGSKYESHIMTAASSVKLILRNFHMVIKTNMEEPPSTFVDISREERHAKCLACYSVLSSIKAMITSSQSAVTLKQASLYKEILLLMQGLD